MLLWREQNMRKFNKPYVVSAVLWNRTHLNIFQKKLYASSKNNVNNDEDDDGSVMIQVHKQKCMVFVFMRDLPSFIMMCTGLKRETGIELHFKKPKSIFLVWKLAFAFKATGYFMHGIPLIYYSTFIDTLHSLGIIIFTYLSSKFPFQFFFRIAIQNIHSFF